MPARLPALFWDYIIETSAVVFHSAAGTRQQLLIQLPVGKAEGRQMPVQFSLKLGWISCRARVQEKDPKRADVDHFRTDARSEIQRKLFIWLRGRARLAPLRAKIPVLI